MLEDLIAKIRDIAVDFWGVVAFRNLKTCNPKDAVEEVFLFCRLLEEYIEQMVNLLLSILVRNFALYW